MRCSVFDYVYILFWNSLWTLLAVVGIGLFDRILGTPRSPGEPHEFLILPSTDSQVLMDLPELYHYGRESYWFSMRDFWIYILDGMYQVSEVSPRVYIWLIFPRLPVRHHLLPYHIRLFLTDVT